MSSFGEIAYQAYGDTREWSGAGGDPMPSWDHQSPDIRQAWEAATQGVVAAVLERQG